MSSAVESVSVDAMLSSTIRARASLISQIMRLLVLQGTRGTVPLHRYINCGAALFFVEIMSSAVGSVIVDAMSSSTRKGPGVSSISRIM